MANSPSQNLSGRILLVDDNSMGLAARRSVLEELGHYVQTAGTAGDALELCGKQAFDVVVTDYKMPKMNGVEFIGRLRKLHPATSVILISGFTDTLGLDEATTGADIVLQKSNNEVGQLIRAVNRLLRKQQAPPKKPSGSQGGPKNDKRKTR
ncbi:MAG TPA: response regulator [Bryobacteraceae bacterium]|jgi:CheY-like chemotaxis protein|nr:response regulator [Bryobacteraceae bacterium]